MLKVTEQELALFDERHPGVAEKVNRLEARPPPPCATCGSVDTAAVLVGVIGRTVSIAAATTRAKLIPSGESAASYYCDACGTFFDPGGWHPSQTGGLRQR